MIMTEDARGPGRHGGGERERGVFAGLGRLAANHPWRVIAVWVIAAIAVIGFAPQLTSTSDEASFLPSHYESIQAANLQQSAFPQAAAPAAIIVLERADGSALTAADSATVQQIATKLQRAHIADVTSLQVGQPSANKLIQTVGVQMPKESDAQATHQTDAVKALRPQLQSALSGTDLKGGITGTAAQTLDSQSSSNSSGLIVGVGTVGLIIVLLLVIFRSPIAALLPIVTIGLLSQVADGLIALASKAFNLQGSSSVTSLLIVVLAIAVAVTLLAGLTLIPAIVSLLGPRVFWPSKAWRTEPKGARFTAIGKALGRHPARFAGVAAIAMAALAIGAFSFHPSFDLSAGSTSSTAESTVWQTQLQRGEPAGATNPTEVLVKSDNGAKLSASELAAFRSDLAGVSGVGTVSQAIPNPADTVAFYEVFLTHDPASSAALNTVKGPLRTTTEHQTAPAGTTALVGGTTAVYVDIQAAMNHDYSVVFPVAAVIIALILALVLRSVVAPLYLLASVGLGFAATLGSTVLLFQHGSNSNGLIFMLPIIMYMFVVALGTDYNILMITRLREESREGRPPREAAAEAVRHAGPTIASAGLILAGSFASLMLAGQSLLTQMGFAITAGIVIAAFVMAMFLTPALTAMLGHAAWWPGRADAKKAVAPRQALPDPEEEEAGVAQAAFSNPD
jgi:RND superfamily putative drug exporter